MADKKKGVDALHTPKGIMLFPNLFKPRPPAEGAKDRFSIVMLFDEVAQKGADYQALRRSVAAAVAAEWGADKLKDPAFMARIKTPFRPASDKPDWPGMKPGMVWISPWSYSKPGVVDGQLQDMIESEVWSGQIVRANVRPFAFNVTGNMGVAFGLNNLQITKPNAARLDGRKPARDVFAADTSDMEDALADDESPF